MGLHLIPNNLNINFVGFRHISYCLSAVLIIIGIVALAMQGGPKYGIDFAGGTIVQVKFKQAISDEEVKNALSGSDLAGLVVQSVGDDSTSYLLRIAHRENETAQMVSDEVNSAIKANLPGHEYEEQRVEMVGPKVGADLRSKALAALYFATLLMSVYISGRFEHRWTTAVLMAVVLAGGMYLLDEISSYLAQHYDIIISKAWHVLAAFIITVILCCKLRLAFALGALVSIVHDLLITVGIFALMGKEFDLTIIAALLTVVGYSLNDTIIVYDRIRENLYADTKASLTSLINLSINQTLSRTALTSGTTLLIILSLLLLGGDIIHDFALIMFFGVLVGTFSSIFVASPVLLFFEPTIKQRAEEVVAERQKAKRRKNVPQV